MRPCPDNRPDHPWSHCAAPRSKSRGPCHGHAVEGTNPERCRMHAGGHVPMAKARVRAELANWTLGDPVDDPADVLLRLITQSRSRAEFYATLLAQAYDAAERVANAAPADRDGLAEDLQRDLDTVLQSGGVAALIGKTYSAAGKEGHIFATGEAIRGLAKLEADERDRCANFCRLAIGAGIAERQVRVAEQLAVTLQAVLVGALDDAGLTGDQRQAVVASAGRRLALVTTAG